MASNPYRGEISLKLGESDYTLRPSFAALAEIESRTGLGILNIARNFAEGDLPLTAQAEILRAGIVAAGGTPPPQLPDLMLQAGLVSLQPLIAQFLMAGCGVVPSSIENRLEGM